MARLIKRYGSRKLYDPAESQYISLETIAEWVRAGDEVSVIDNKTGEDVTVQTLTQVISEEGRKGGKFLPSDLLHDLIRTGNNMVGERVRKLQTGVEGFVKHSLDRIMPVSKVRDEMSALRLRLEELESAVKMAETRAASEASTVVQAVEKAVPAKTIKKTVRKKPAASAKKTTSASRTAASKKAGSQKVAASSKTAAKTPRKRTPRKNAAVTETN